MAAGMLYQDLLRRKRMGQPAFAVLADPDKSSPLQMERLGVRCDDAGVDYLLVGGSLVVSDELDACIRAFKANSNIPVILFPGSPAQVTREADALLYLSLISGRNPELLIGQHVISAPVVKASGLEVMATGYMVIDGGSPTTVSYISGSAPIPANKPDIALCTAWAGELLNMHLLYMDAGSGARSAVPVPMIEKVSTHTQAPLFIGGGMRQPEDLYVRAKAGATVLVVGNAIEEDDSLISEMSAAVHAARQEVTG